MAIALFFILAIAGQTIAQSSVNVGVPSQRVSVSSSSSSSSSVSYSSSSSVSGSSSSSLPIQELLSSQSSLNSRLQAQTIALNQAKQTFSDQVSSWYFLSNELQGGFEEAISVVGGLVDQATSYIQGSERLLNAIKSAGSGAQQEWIVRVQKLQSLGELAISRAEEGVSAIVRNCADFAADQKVYADAKAQQLVETKTQMDSALEHLLEQTLQVGVQASGVLSQGIKDWTTILREHLGPEASISAINRLNEVAAPTQADLARLRPEDIETALNDAHRTIEDIKGLFYASGIPSNLIRQSVNPVQLGVFATLTRARNIH